MRLSPLLFITACAPAIGPFIDGFRIQTVGDGNVIDLRLSTDERMNRIGIDLDTLEGWRLEEGEPAPIEVTMQVVDGGFDVLLRPHFTADLCRFDRHGDCVPDDNIVLWSNRAGVEVEASAAHELKLTHQGDSWRFCVMEVFVAEEDVFGGTAVVELWLGPQ